MASSIYGSKYEQHCSLVRRVGRVTKIQPLHSPCTPRILRTVTAAHTDWHKEKVLLKAYNQLLQNKSVYVLLQSLGILHRATQLWDLSDTAASLFKKQARAHSSLPSEDTDLTCGGKICVAVN